MIRGDTEFTVTTDPRHPGAYRPAPYTDPADWAPAGELRPSEIRAAALAIRAAKVPRGCGHDPNRPGKWATHRGMRLAGDGRAVERDNQEKYEYVASSFRRTEWPRGR